MATYSRTVTTTTKESQASTPQVASKELSSIIVKALENVESEKDTNKNENAISEQITRGINYSDLLKSSDSPAKKTSEMLDLLQKDSKEQKDKDKTDKKERDKQNSESKTLLAKIHTTNKKSHDSISAFAKDFAAKALIWTAVGSQIFILLKAGLYSLIEKSEANRIKIMAKIHGALSTIPDKIKLSLEKVLSKVRIMGQPIFGQLSADEKKELKSLEKDKDIKAYNKAMKGVDNIDKTLNTTASQWGAGSVNAFDYDLDTEAGRESYKQAVIEQANKTRAENGMPELNLEYANQEIDKWLIERDRKKADAEKEIQKLKLDSEKIEKYQELKARSQQALDDNFFEQEEAKIEAKARTSEEEYVQQKVEEMASSKEGIKATTYQELQKSYGGAVAAAEANFEMQGRDFKIADLNKRESWLQNEFQDWKDSWKDFGKHLSQNVGVQIVQKTETKNPVTNR